MAAPYLQINANFKTKICKNTLYVLSSETRVYGLIFLKAVLKAFGLRPGFSWVNYLKHVVEGWMYRQRKAGRERKEGLAQWGTESCAVNNPDTRYLVLPFLRTNCLESGFLQTW